MIRSSINILYSGKIVTISPTSVEGDEELRYRTMHSLNDVQTGIIDVNHVNGMYYSATNGYSPNLESTRIVRRVIEESTFRSSLIKYIQKYVYADDASVLRTIGRDNTDSVVVQRLSLLPRRSIPNRIDSRVYTVTNILSRIPHIPISQYLDYGTGDGTVADAIGKALGVSTYGVDVFSMDRPIPTTIVNEGDNLPSEWTNKFHLITAFVVLHHVRDQQHVLNELYRVLSPGGILILREHDYRDMTPASVLMKQKIHVDDVQGTTSNTDTTIYPHTQYEIGGDPYRHFIDAIHIVSMAFTKEPSFWSQYRSSMEWNVMMQQAGFSHMCTNMRSTMDKRVNPDNNWINTNPQRLYESVYRKDPLPNTSLIIEYRIDRSISIHNIFPKIGGSTGTIPTVVSGINYDDEVLAYMTPWYPAQQTSILISKLVYANYLSPDKKYSIYDGTGGGGGNAIAFMSNPNISTINVYERVDKFYRYIVNNLSLYSGTTPVPTRDGVKILSRGTTYVHNVSFDIQDPSINLRGSVLYLDVPWVSSGCGYKLYGYKYSDMSLEMLTYTAIRKGAYMVVLKLPPNYNLRMRHDVEEVGSMSLYIIHRKYIPRDNTGIGSANELIRYRLMDYVRRQYRQLFPSGGKDDYYVWLYERLTRGSKDPLIPSIVDTYTPTIDSMIDMHWPSMPFDQLSDLIEQKYPSLIQQLHSTLFLDEEAVVRLRTSLAREMAIDHRDEILNKLSTLDNIVNDMYNRYLSLSSSTDIGTTISIDSAKGTISVNPNSTLRTTLLSLDRELGYVMKYPQCHGTKAFMCMNILPSKIDSLRKRYNGSSFDTDIASMCMRYASLMEPSKESLFSGVNIHAAIPVSLFNMASKYLRVDTECFASPLNATLDRYMSAFPDTDMSFGSIGSFYSYTFDTDGSYEVNPPFIPYMIQTMIDRLDIILDRDVALSFMVVVPDWNVDVINMIKTSRWNRYDIVIQASRHRFRAGQQHIVDTSFTSTFNTYVAILQSTRGVDKYPIPNNMGSLIQSSFQ